MMLMVTIYLNKIPNLAYKSAMHQLANHQKQLQSRIQIAIKCFKTTTTTAAATMTFD